MQQHQSPPAASSPGEGARGLVKWAEKVQSQATRVVRAARSAGKAASVSWKGLETAHGAAEGVQKVGEAAPRKVGEGASAAKEQLENRKEEAQVTSQKAAQAGRNITEALGTAKERLASNLGQQQTGGKPQREAASQQHREGPENAEKGQAQKPPESASQNRQPPEDAEKRQAQQRASEKPPPEPGSQSREPAGYLGMTTLPVQLPQDVAEAQHSPRGLILLNVEKDGPADEAGLQLGDTLIKLDGRSLNEVGDLVERLSKEHVGQAIQATILRSGSTRDVTLTVQPRP